MTALLQVFLTGSLVWIHKVAMFHLKLFLKASRVAPQEKRGSNSFLTVKLQYLLRQQLFPTSVCCHLAAFPLKQVQND